MSYILKIQSLNLIFKMNFNQELYKEFIERKRAKQAEPQDDPYTIKRRSLLRTFLDLPDDVKISLEASITLLKKLELIQSLQSVDDIVAIMQRKRKLATGWNGSDQELLQCRFIYFLWAVIEEETVELREFKQIILTLISDNKGRAEAIRNAYGDKQGIVELIQSWDCLMQSSLEKGNSKTNLMVVSTQSQQSISDISIIKSKNQGNAESNKENISYFQDEQISTSRNIKSMLNKTNCQSNYNSNHLEKSFQRRDSKAKLNASRSSSKMVGRKSNTNMASSGVRTANFFTNNQNLSSQEEKNLISRLYRYDQYKQREELKRQVEAERVKAELEQCSFKPKLGDRGRAMSKSKVVTGVKGYQKAIDRMKSGYKRNKQLKQNLQYRIWHQPPTTKTLQPSRLSAPKFLTRVKQPQVELFQIVFTIGRNSIRVKIKQTDKISDIVTNIGQIYSLKEDSKEYIRGIIEEELNSYYEAKCREEEQGQMEHLVQ